MASGGGGFGDKYIGRGGLGTIGAVWYRVGMMKEFDLDNLATVAHMNEMRTSIENRLNTLTTVGVGILVGMLMVVIGAVASGILN